MKSLWGLLAAALLLSSCATVGPSREASSARGSLIRLQHIGAYSVEFMRTVEKAAKLPEPFEIADSIDLYRLSYWTVFDGHPTKASGLLSLPRVVPVRGVVSYQHGTTAKKDDVPSALNSEGLFTAALFAGNAYIFVAPDYIGLGISSESHPFLYSEASSDAVVDMLGASRAAVETLGKSWSPSLYLVGVSQGGHATAVSQRALETQNDPAFAVRAAASIAGPLDLSRRSVSFGLEGHSGNAAFYFAYLADSYARIYGQPLSSLIKEKYLKILGRFLDGRHADKAIKAALPVDPKELLSPQILADFEAHADNWFLNALAKNDADNWAPRAPLRLYYGSEDRDVAPDVATDSAARMTALGGRASAVDLGPYDHVTSAFRGLPRILTWFNELSSGPIVAR